MTDRSIDLKGVPGTDAVASKRGYYYQDVVTALAWLKLRAGELLHLEVAEDFARDDGHEVSVEQIRNVSARLTLSNILVFLERAIAIKEENPGLDLAFVYRTTAKAGRGSKREHKDLGSSCLEYLNDVKNGRDPAVLIEFLRIRADKVGRLKRYLESHSAEKAVTELFSKISWATGAPSSSNLEQVLTEQLAKIGMSEIGGTWAENSQLLPIVLNEVQRASMNPAESERRLTFAGLRELLKSRTSKTLPLGVYEQLIRDSSIARNPPTQAVDDDTRRRLEQLRATRFFAEATTRQTAKQLADDVSVGGSNQVASKELRALAMSWAARLLLEEDQAVAKSLLMEAEALAPQQHITLVKALLHAQTDPVRALAAVQTERGSTAMTIRYAIARKEHNGDGWPWLQSSSLNPEDFDADGSFLIIWDHFLKQRWDEAYRWWERIPEVLVEESIALVWAGAHATMAQAISLPDNARDALLYGPPVINELPMSDDAVGLAARRKAAALFSRFQGRAAAAGLSKASTTAQEFTLWLRLSDRPTRATAISEISRLWEANSHEMRWIPLLVQAGVSIDRKAIAQELDRRGRVYGSLNYDDARARLALLVSSPAVEWIEKWAVLHGWLSQYFSEAFLQQFHIRGLIHAKRMDDAKRLIESASELSKSTRAQLLLEVEPGNTEASLATLRAEASRTDSLGAQYSLFRALLQAKQFDEAATLGHSLFNISHDHEHAEELLELWVRMRRFDEVLGFIESHQTLIEQSALISKLYFDALFVRGRWEDARRHLATTPSLFQQKRDIELNLALYSCDWDSLGLQLESAITDSTLSSEDQIRFATIATAFNRVPLAKRLVKAAASQSPSSADMLWSCYLLAIRGRWEDDRDVAGWLQVAVDHAGPNGPVRRGSLEELAEIIPRQRRWSEELWSAIASAETFMALVCRQVNKPLAALLLEVADSNRRSRDPRFRSPISAFFGKARTRLTPRPRIIAIDQTALLTLAHLEFLPRLKESFDRIYVPHATGPWLFEEQCETQFHQPSRIHDAQRILSAIARREVHVLEVDRRSSTKLAAEIGEEMAQLVLAARQKAEHGGPAYVIRSAPVYRAGSLALQAADLGEYSRYFRSTLELFRSLKLHGVIDEPGFEAGKAFLERNDKGWPHDEEIPAGSSLYLDEVSIAYIQRLDLWSSLAKADFKLFVHPAVQNEAATLDRSNSTVQAVQEAIEAIRRFVRHGFATGLVRSLKRPSDEEQVDLEGSAPRFLLPQLLEHENEVEAIVVDDRAGNRHSQFDTREGKNLPCCTSLDILDWALDGESIDFQEWCHFRTQLRQSGFLFVPASSEELAAAMASSVVRNGTLVESVAARAIRESQLLAQTSEMLVTPDEAPWLSQQALSIGNAVVALWKNGVDTVENCAKSSWLVELSRLDGFVGRLPGVWNEARFHSQDAITLSRFVLLEISKARRGDYNTWLEENFLREMRQDRPLAFDALCQSIVHYLGVIRTVRHDNNLSDTENQHIVSILSKEFLNALPPSIRDQVFYDDNLLQLLGVQRTSRVTIGIEGSPSFDINALYLAAQVSYSVADQQLVLDQANHAWAVTAQDDGSVTCSSEDDSKRFVVRHAELVSLDQQVRSSYLMRLARESLLEESDLKSWIEAINVAPLDPLRLRDFDNDLADSPTAMVEILREAMERGQTSRSELVPLTLRYYERLVPPSNGHSTLGAFAESIVDRLTSADVGKIVIRLSWSAHSKLVPVASISALDPQALERLVRSMLPSIDVWSLTGLIEAMIARHDITTHVHLLKELLSAFSRVLDEQSGRLRLAVGLVAVSDGRLNASSVFTNIPVYWRRLAAISHAALIERAVVAASVSIEEFASWTEQALGEFQNAALTDLWREPRWSGFMLAAGQLKQEFLGRVVAACMSKRDQLLSTEVGALIFGEQAGSLISLRVEPFSSLPGPLEGASADAQPLPEHFIEMIAAHLSDASIPLSSRILAFTHVCGLGEIHSGQLASLVEAVRELGFADSLIDDSEAMAPFLFRLALTAAATRNYELANAVRDLLIQHTNIPFAMRVYAGLLTCGAESDEASWATAVNGWISRNAPRDLSRDDAKFLLQVLEILASARPMLRRETARTSANLRGSSMRLG